MKALLFIMPNLENPLSFQTGFPKSGPTYGGKWLIHGNKHCKDN